MATDNPEAPSTAPEGASIVLLAEGSIVPPSGGERGASLSVLEDVINGRQDVLQSDAVFKRLSHKSEFCHD